DVQGEREAVRVNTGRREPEDDVAGPNAVAVDDAISFDHADREADEVVLVPRVDGRHLGDLAADQRTPGTATALGDSRDDALDAAGIHTTRADVVEEVQRLGPVHEHVVDTHGDEIDADRLVTVGAEGDPELRTDAVGRGHQDGLD